MEASQTMESLLFKAIELEGHKIPNTKQLARETLHSGWFQRTATDLDLPWRFIARCMEVHPPALRKWVRGEKEPSRISSLKISLFRLYVDDLVETVDREFWKSALPLKSLAMVRGESTEQLLKRCHGGLLDCYDLGILGIWAEASPAEMEAHSRARAVQVRREK